MHYFGRFWGEADIEPDFMSTRPSLYTLAPAVRPERLARDCHREEVSPDLRTNAARLLPMLLPVNQRTRAPPEPRCRGVRLYHQAVPSVV